MLKRMALLPLVLTSLAAWAAGAPSGAAPTDLLVANFMVGMLPGSPDLTGDVDMEQLAAANGVEQSKSLDLSSDESLTFNVGGTTIPYNPAGANVLPIQYGATYQLNYKRANGEAYTSSVLLAKPALFTAPAPNSIFKPAEGVQAAWSGGDSDLIMVAVSGNCAAVLDAANLDDSGTALNFPAGSATKCQPGTWVEVDVLSVNGGTGFGGLVSMSETSLQFSYDMGQKAAFAQPLSRQQWASLIRTARRSGQRLIRIHR